VKKLLQRSPADLDLFFTSVMPLATSQGEGGGILRGGKDASSPPCKKNLPLSYGWRLSHLPSKVMEVVGRRENGGKEGYWLRGGRSKEVNEREKMTFLGLKCSLRSARNVYSRALWYRLNLGRSRGVRARRVPEGVPGEVGGGGRVGVGNRSPREERTGCVCACVRPARGRLRLHARQSRKAHKTSFRRKGRPRWARRGRSSSSR